ncbi:hypothetical protein [Bradyrhizobium neotropicale]|uniref:hypothetical protein n=1 Tax=Bradyrhizobium neotropicale TaxID=1497615 RepID=UPI001AD6A0BD|nr:hypothetical protein [Bradyrhizobium neotropicale]MBO4228010.1 hypothetical protein [Bradyrhizobium neotropicale]
MCDPLTGAALAASAGGSLINGMEANDNANRVAAARNAATLAELQRQRVYGDQARGEFDKSMDLYAPGAQAASLAKAQGDIGSIIQGNAPTAESVGSITTANAPKVVATTEGNKLGAVFSRIGQNAINLGNLKGYDQNTFNTNLGLAQTGRDIDRIGDFSKTSAAVNKMEQNAAATNAQKAPSGIGDLLSFAGNVGAYYGGGGKLGLPKFGGSTTLPTSALTSTGALY